MKYLQKFENFKDTMIGNIFTSDYDNEISNIFKEIKDNFNYNNLNKVSDGMGTIEYDLNGTKIQVRDDTFFAIPGYTVVVDDIDIKCSFLLAKKIYKFLKNKFDLQKKENIKNNISNLGRSSKKYNL